LFETSFAEQAAMAWVPAAVVTGALVMSTAAAPGTKSSAAIRRARLFMMLSSIVGFRSRIAHEPSNVVNAGTHRGVMRTAESTYLLASSTRSVSANWVSSVGCAGVVSQRLLLRQREHQFLTCLHAKNAAECKLSAHNARDEELSTRPADLSLWRCDDRSWN
jgi:hypothetical protein